MQNVVDCSKNGLEKNDNVSNKYIDKMKQKLATLYPKMRPKLPEVYKRIYLEQYVTNREGLSLGTRMVKWLETWGHRKCIESPSEYPLLEIGAGTLNHVPYEADIHPIKNSDSKKIYDIVEPFS